MKKTMVYVLALTLAFSALLSGCGDMRRPEGSKATPTAAPQQTVQPGTMTPDPKDGVVRDDDGIITKEDSGNVTEKGTAKEPEGKAGVGGEKPASGQTGTAKS